jgi:hypothetical protein
MNPQRSMQKLGRCLHHYWFNSVPNHTHEIDLTKLAPIYRQFEPSTSRTLRNGPQHHRQTA